MYMYIKLRIKLTKVNPFILFYYRILHNECIKIKLSKLIRLL